MNMEAPVTLTVRGALAASSLEEALQMHDATAGSPEGIAAARSLGDLSHKVYSPVIGGQSSAKKGELLFLDVWVEPQGIMQFFSDPQVQKAGAALFSAREPTVWMPAVGSYSYSLPAARGREARYVALVRGPIGKPEHAIEVFRKADQAAVRDARRRGILAHSTSSS